MRLLSRTIYRAFPELDRYGDEQCIRFVRAARGAWFRRTIGLLVATSVGIVGTVPGIAVVLTTMADGRFDPTVPPLRLGMLVGLFAATIAVAPGPFLAFIVRDWLLRRRVRFVLRTRGVCRQCWYSLVGLAVDPDNTVRCPECGGQSEVDPSLGELVTDKAGRARFKPEHGGDMRGVFWTPRRSRIALRTLLWGLIALISLAVVVGGSYEAFLRVQAARARAARVASGNGVRALLEYVEKHQPPGALEGSPNAWEPLAEAVSIAKKLDGRIWLNKPQPVTGAYPEYSYLYREPKPNSESAYDAPALHNACKALARRMMDELDQAGVPDLLREMAGRPRAVRPVEIAPGAPLCELRTDVGIAALARYCAARAALALKSADRATYLESMESLLALARVSRLQPLLFDQGNAERAEALAAERAVGMLVAPPSLEWVDALATVMARQAVSVPADYHLKGQQIVAADTIDWMFSDPDRVRLGVRSAAFANLRQTSWIRVRRLGRYAANRAALSNYVSSHAAAAIAEPRSRPATRASSGFTLPDIQMIRWMGSESTDQVLVAWRGIPVMIALERWKHAHGSYPASLDELVPEQLAAIPADPWRAGPLSYRRIDPATDPRGRGYLLYSVDTDGIDNGGIIAETARDRKTLVSNPGDLVINRIDESEQRP